jgi:hypothetical protein
VPVKEESQEEHSNDICAAAATPSVCASSEGGKEVDLDEVHARRVECVSLACIMLAAKVSTPPHLGHAHLSPPYLTLCCRFSIMRQLEYCRRCSSVERLIRASESVRTALARADDSSARLPLSDGAVSPALPTSPGTPSTSTGYSSSSTGASVAGLYSEISGGGSCRGGYKKSRDHSADVDTSDSLRQQRQRDVLSMERCLLDQWFCDLPTIPIPIKVRLPLHIVITFIVRDVHAVQINGSVQCS